MELFRLAQGLAINRIAFGAGLIVAPSLYARPWIGRGASDERVQVLARALGARDLALGVGGLLAWRDGDVEWARRAFAAQAFADGVDVVAILAAGDRVPLASRIAGGVLATGSAAVAAAYARRLAGD
jgi:hypothetical protein